MVDVLEQPNCECHLFCDYCGYISAVGDHYPEDYDNEFIAFYDTHRFEPGGHFPDCPFGPQEGDED